MSDLSPLTVNTQRVNAAVGIAVRRKMSETTSVDNRRALEHSIGKRIQGTYGAELRKWAEADPDLSAAELCEAVIVPVEWPTDLAPEPSVYSGQRDRARAKRDGPFLEDYDESLTDAVIWCAGILAARSAVATQTRKASPPVEVDPDPQYAAQFAQLRANIDAGIQRNAQDRAARRRTVA